MSCVGKETDFEVRRQFAGCKRFTPTRGVCVLATRDGILLPGVQTICPRPGMREYGLQTGRRCLQNNTIWKLETVDQNVIRGPARDLTRDGHQLPGVKSLRPGLQP